MLSKYRIVSEEWVTATNYTCRAGSRWLFLVGYSDPLRKRQAGALLHRTGYYFIKGIIPIRARGDYGWVRETPNLMWCWYCGEFWVHVKEKMG